MDLAEDSDRVEMGANKVEVRIVVNPPASPTEGRNFTTLLSDLPAVHLL